MKVFSKEKLLGRPLSKEEKEAVLRDKWVDECDGKPVKNGKCGCYFIDDDWCVDVPEPEHVNCRCVMKPVNGQKEEKKVYTMKDFREKKIAVRTGEGGKQRKFLGMCEKEGLTWLNGLNATELRIDRHGKECCITCGFHKEGTLEHCEASFYKERGWEIIDFEEIAEAASKRYKITIESDGTTTTARMEVNGEEVKTAQAKRNPADKFSLQTGAELAFTRLFINRKKKKDKPERTFCVGDEVVCTAAFEGNERIVGKRGKVIEKREGECGVEFYENVDGHTCFGNGRLWHCWWCPDEILRHV